MKTRSIDNPLLYSIIALATLGAISIAEAQTFDPAALTVARIQQDPAAIKRLNKDGFFPTKLVFKNRQRAGNMQLYLDRAKTALPDALILQDQTIRNCGSGVATMIVKAEGKTENTESYSVSNMLGGSTTVEVAYESPLSPVKAKVSQTFEYSNTKSRTDQKTTSRAWGSEFGVPVPAMRQSLVQYQVETRNYQDVPWDAELEVAGPVDITFGSPIEVCVFEAANYKGGKKCWRASKELQELDFYGMTFDNGSPLNDNISSMTIKGKGKAIFHKHARYGGWRAEYTQDFPDFSKGYGSGANPDNQFSSMLISPAEVTEQRVIEQILVNKPDRLFKISGLYSGAGGASGNWFTEDTGPAENCSASQRATTSSVGAAALPGAGLSVIQGNIKTAKPIKRPPAKQG